MSSVAGLLITVRTARQGAAMESGKGTPEYLAEIATLRVAAVDLATLALAPGQKALLKSAYGETVVACQGAEGPPGIFFLPLGPVANRVFGASATHGSGVPDWKGLEVVLTPYAKIVGKADEETGAK